MNESLKRIKDRIKPHHFVFFAFLFLNAAVLYSVPLFGDDYYYGSFIKKGLSFFVTENVVHYVKTNGRAVVHLLDQLLLVGGTNILWKVFNLISLGFAVFFTAATISIKDKSRFGQSLVITCCLTALLELAIVRQSFFWATGSMNYLFPYALFITYYYLLRCDVIRGSSAPYLWILGFFAGFSTEQAGFAAVAVTVAIIVYQSIRQKNVNHPHLYTNLVATAAGFALQIFAPGNAARTTYYPEFYEKSIFGRIAENAKPLYRLIFNADGIYIFVMLMLVCFLFAGIKQINKKQPPKSVLLSITAIITAIAIFFYIKAVLFNRLILTELNFLVFFSLSLIFFTVFFIIRAFKQRDFDSLLFFALAPVLQFAMLLSPQYGPRTLLISAFCLFVPLSSMLLELLQSPVFASLAAVLVAIFVPSPLVFIAAAVLLVFVIVRLINIKTPPKKIYQTAVFVLLITLSFSHIALTAYGYYRNLDAHKKNNAAVEQYKQNGGDQLVLYKLPYPDYKYTMPYDDNYHLYWYKIINDLPADTVIVFMPYNLID